MEDYGNINSLSNFKKSIRLVLAVGIFSLSTHYFNDLIDPEIKSSKDQYSIQVKDLNHNGIPEKYYTINGKKVFLSIDGKSLENSLKD